MYKLGVLVILLYSIILYPGCTLPQYVWPQKDVSFFEINERTLEKKILIASRKSDFKIDIIDEVQRTFVNKGIYIKIVGIETLKNEDANNYSAVLILNTAMAWEIDRKVESFLQRFGDSNSIIVLTTSGSGDFLPDMNGRQVDAVSAASSKNNINPTADKIIRKINELIERAQ